MDGGFPIDLILFGMVAVFLVLRLGSVLGKRTGFEKQAAEPVAPAQPVGGTAPSRPQRRVIDAVAEPPVPTRPLPAADSPIGVQLAAMAATDRSFQTARFLDGAESAFRIIVQAFADGERTRLHPLLSDDAYRAFEGAIAAREAEGHVQRTEIRSIESAVIEQAELVGTQAAITVRFVSDQVNLTTDRAGMPVAGADAVTEMTDIWRFERNLGQPDPAWRLISAQSA